MLNLNDAIDILYDRKLNAAERKVLATSDFALPKERKYPIPDVEHAHAALSRLSQALHDGRITKAQYRSAIGRIHAKYPKIAITNEITGKRLGDAVKALVDIHD